MSADEFKYEAALLDVVDKFMFKLDGNRRERALDLLREGYAALPKGHELKRNLGNTRLTDLQPPTEVPLLRHLLGTTALHKLAAKTRAKQLEAMGERGTLFAWLDEPFTTNEDVLDAAIRLSLGIDKQADTDRKNIEALLGRQLRGASMPIKYTFDPRGLPPSADFDPAAFEAFVGGNLDDTIPHVHVAMRNFVLGAMSLDGFLPQDRSSQERHIRDLRFESERTTRMLDGSTRLAREALDDIKKALDAERGGRDGDGDAYYEELAFVARRLLTNTQEVPIDAPGLRQRVASELTEYVAPDAGGSLNIPSLSDPETAEADLVPENIRAVALVYAAWNLEELKLFQVLDRVTEVWMNGQLPTGFDAGGRALSDYYFDPDDKRLTEAARRMTYGRVLGVPGGEVSKEAPPNRTFQDLFLRFLASVSEYDRQRRIDDVVGVRARIDVLSNTGEQVRKAGFDLAANASLFGFGGTYFVAQRLANQIERALRILSVPEILSAYGVQSPFQVIERVSAADLGGTVPNVVQRRTMAEAGKIVLDTIAAYTAIWPGSSQPLFGDTVDPTINRPTNADIPAAVQDKLGRAVEQWLAVNGIKDEQRARLGEPQVSAPVPSIPTAPGDGASGPAFDQIKQMITAGQTPSLDQLKALMPDGAGMVRM